MKDPGEEVIQDVHRHAASGWLTVDEDGAIVAGYYTLAAAGVPLAEMPLQLAKKLPRYPSVPIARMGRLAVDQAYRGQRLGSTLVWDAATRAARSEVAVFALVVDAKDDQAGAFYLHLGFVAFGSLSGQFLLPLARFSGTR